jgi:hypothetical protein
MTNEEKLKQLGEAARIRTSAKHLMQLLDLHADGTTQEILLNAANELRLRAQQLEEEVVDSSTEKR